MRKKRLTTPACGRYRRGFSLIELMVVVAVVGILAMIAVPAYDRQVMRSNRSAAQQHLMAVASKQEQYLLDARAYAATITALSMAPAGTNRYTFSTDTAGCAPAPCYVITATAINQQVSDGDLTINNLGQKTGKWTTN